MREPTLRELTQEDLRNELDRAIEMSNQRRQESIVRELRRRDRIEIN